MTDATDTDESPDCPFCGSTCESKVWVYPRVWACGTTLAEWKQGYHAEDPVPQRSKACLRIAELTQEVKKLREHPVQIKQIMRSETTQMLTEIGATAEACPDHEMGERLAQAFNAWTRAHAAVLTRLVPDGHLVVSRETLEREVNRLTQQEFIAKHWYDELNKLTSNILQHVNASLAKQGDVVQISDIIASFPPGMFKHETTETAQLETPQAAT